MPTTGNKRVSQLIELTAGEIALNDLFLVIDVTAKESKKIQTSEFATWLNTSGSLRAYYANFADTASYVFGYNVHGPVESASFSTTSSLSYVSLISSQSLQTISASFSATASYALSGSWPKIITGSTYPITASWAINSINSPFANTASYLLYFGGDNGTASYAINSLTASYLQDMGPNESSSYALHADTASYLEGSTNSASYLIYQPTEENPTPDNGTASYAISAGTLGRNVLNNFGIFGADTQTISSSTLTSVLIESVSGETQKTLIQVFGNAILNFTSSDATNLNYIYLYALNKRTGRSGIADSSNIALNLSTTMNSWGNPSSGSLYIPFTLTTQRKLYGDYYLEVSASNSNIQIDPYRPIQFSISSYNPDVIVEYDPIPHRFWLAPSESVLIYFSSSEHPTAGILEDYLDGFSQTGSQFITYVNVSSQEVKDLRYTWCLSNMLTFDCSNNPELSSLDYGFAPSLKELIADNCNLIRLANLDNLSASYVNIRYNQLTSLPLLPPSLSFIDYSNNPINNLPEGFPMTLQVVFGNDTMGTGVFPVMPDCTLTASLYNTQHDELQAALPLSLSYLDVHNTLISTMSTAPISLSYLDVSNALFDVVALENVTTELVANGQLTGTFKMNGYGPPETFTLINNLGLLEYNEWTVEYDT